MFTSVLSLLVRLSAGSDGIVSIVTELLELVVVMVSVAAAVFSTATAVFTSYLLVDVHQLL